MQLDIFEHSRDVILRNAAIDALRERDPGTSGILERVGDAYQAGGPAVDSGYRLD